MDADHEGIEGGGLSVELPASFVEAARAVGMDPQLLAEFMLACISSYTADKLAHFLRQAERELSAERYAEPRDVAEVSVEAAD